MPVHCRKDIHFFVILIWKRRNETTFNRFYAEKLMFRDFKNTEPEFYFVEENRNAWFHLHVMIKVSPHRTKEKFKVTSDIDFTEMMNCNTEKWCEFHLFIFDFYALHALFCCIHFFMCGLCVWTNRNRFQFMTKH